MYEPIFALDIGTQSVTGILLKQEQKKYEIVDYYVRQHDERAMLDGQIQNVVQVAEIINEVKNYLAEKYGPLKHVYVAAAGRALKTVKASVTIPIHERTIRSEEEVKHLELSAVQQAQQQLLAEENEQFKDYHCVGYSVLHYKLDGDIIGSFIDQVGQEVTVEIIATFLPRVVVESLVASLERAGLKMKALTLEPIAAIHVLVPESMRRLNVALIDIGAGTSDIAITRDGTVIAYGMVPVAGDEITEKISDHFLLDFKQAEEVKRTVVKEKTATVEDILGFETTITYDELVAVIEENVDQLAKLLADKIKELNKQTPQAVMLIGGGSLTPMINEKIARYLDLPQNRVAVRGTEAIQKVATQGIIPEGPEFVTPVGIAISASENPFEYVNVYVNEKITFMFSMDDLTVGDCLVQAGIDINQYYGKIGLAKFITLNGKQLTIPGTYGSPPVIKVNNELASVETNVKPNDQITIAPGEDGKSPEISIRELVGELEAITCFVNEEKVTLSPTILVNGKQVSADYLVQDKDIIVTQHATKIRDVLEYIGQAPFTNSTFTVYVNGQAVTMKQGQKQLLRNGKLVLPDDIVHNHDRIHIVQAEKVSVKMLFEQIGKPLYTTIDVFFNGKPLKLQQPLHEVKRGKEVLTESSELFHEDELTVKELTLRPFIFQDVFRYIDIDVQEIGGNYQLLRNDEPVSFHDPIHHGDNLEIKTS